MTQPSATMMPPNATISFGPRRAPSVSTIQPWIGVSHVSSAMKMLKANWIDASDQPCALLIGLTNSVQPYCRLAISTMQMMQAMSWPQRVDVVAVASDLSVPVETDMVSVPYNEIFLWLELKPFGRILRDCDAGFSCRVANRRNLWCAGRKSAPCVPAAAGI